MQHFSKTNLNSAATAFAVLVVLIALSGCAPKAVSPTMSPTQTKKDPNKNSTASNDGYPSPPTVQRQAVKDNMSVKLPVTHTVLPGETMYSLSVKYYGTGRDVGRIIRANTDRKIELDNMQIGQKLIIPAIEE